MHIVIDTSAIIAVIINEPERQKLIEATRGFDLIAPESVHWEIGNAFSAMFKRKKLSIEQAKKAIDSYQQIPIKFVTVDLKQALNISAVHNIYAYDAYLIVCALNNKAPLISLDQYLIHKSIEMGIKIIEV